MKQQLQTLKGFEDYLGGRSKKRNWAIQKIRSTLEQLGFEPLETPSLEYEELLMGKYGAEAEKLIYSFEDRGGRRIALRYDQTVPTARIASQYRNELVFPYKRYQVQNVWRADKPQKGRSREFLQFDFDIIGAQGGVSDAEILNAVYACYCSVGLNSVQLLVNDREQLNQVLENAGIRKNMIMSVIQTIDKLDKKTKEDVIEELVQKGIDRQIATRILATLDESKPSEKLSRIIEISKTLGVPKESIVFQPTLARGLDYYTGIITEAVIPGYVGGSIGAGGRYDTLLRDTVGFDIPATGYSIGFYRMLEILDERNLVPHFKNSVDVLVAYTSNQTVDKAIRVLSQLRSASIASELYPHEGKKLEQQFKYANAKHIPFVVIIGEEELESNTGKIKKMTTGDQKVVHQDEIITFLVEQIK